MKLKESIFKNQQLTSLCFQFLYQFQLPVFLGSLNKYKSLNNLETNNEDYIELKTSLEDFLELSSVVCDEKTMKEIIDVILFCLTKIEFINDEINQRSKDSSKITLIDRTIIVFYYALDNLFEEKKSNLINDAVNLAKKFGHQNTFKFVNAILDKLILTGDE